MPRTFTTLRSFSTLFTLTFCMITASADEHSNHDDPEKADQSAFHTASQRDWQEVFFDTGTEDWTQKWFLDGLIASVRNTRHGMQLTAGPRFLNDAHHMVLWTKESFSGDVMIEYEFTRLDFETNAVNILYIQATGSGRGAFDEDISQWSNWRETPAMRAYFDRMHLYHISYAAYGNEETEVTDYIRARRYMPHEDGLRGTELTPDYVNTGLFATGKPHKITVIKTDRDIYMRIENDDQVKYCHFKNPNLPVVTHGRIGLRQMFTRSARYRNFRVSVPAGSQ